MTDDQIINIAWETFPISDKKRNENFIALLVNFARNIEAVEREECAKACEELVIEVVGNSALAVDQCVRAIRTRGLE